MLARRWSESESESTADAARPLERDGSWGNAGGLPVTDRPRARPSSAADQPGRVGIPAGRDNHRNLVAIHDHLRSELEQIRLAVSQVADGELDPGGARTLIARMTLRQNHWTLGSFCASYCRIVTIHHTVEDAHLFPNLDGGTLAGAGVATAGRRTHQVIAEVLDRFDRTLVDLVYEEQGRQLPARSGTAEVGELADELSALLLSHLAYEEDELVAGLARMPGPI